MSDLVGKTILHFNIIEKLGQGGMGVVYLAEDTKLERKIAIKFLPRQILNNSKERERFKIEAKAAASLNHPNITTIHSIEELDDNFFIVMEYIEGKELKEIIKTENFPSLEMKEIINYAIQITEGLEAAHKKGIIHRDIKSQNIMVTNDGKIKIMDFGLAKIIGGVQLTKTKGTIGTIAYMSPEQAKAEAVNTQTDIWSFGVVLYEMLTGELPFKGEYEQAIIYSILNEEPFYSNNALQSFKKILKKMLEKDIIKRYQNINQVKNDLNDIIIKEAAEKKEIKNKMPSIAILPFSDLSPSRDQEFFCEGIAEEILNAVSKIGGLKVSSRTSTFQFKNKSMDIREIGEKLMVDSILEGSVRKAGEKLRVNVQLINIEDGFQLWSDRYDRKLEDVFEVQDDIAGNVVTALKGVFTLDEKEKIKMPETNIAAYEHFLEGRHYFSLLNFPKAISAFEEAIKQDPSYAPAYALLANVYSWRFEWEGRKETDLKEAEKCSKMALQLAENLSESHTARAYVLMLEGNYQEAENEFIHAIKIDPNSYDANYLFARMCFSAGNIKRASEYFYKASEIRKEDSQSMSLLALTYRTMGMKEDFKRANKEAIYRAEKQLELDPTNSRVLSLGAIDLLNSGQKEKALKWQEKVLQLYPDNASALINGTCFYALAGMKSKALNLLEEFINRGYGSRSWIEHDPDYDSLRDEPKFKELMAKLK